MIKRPASLGPKARPASATALFCALAASISCIAAAHDYPTVARVEYVQECISRNGGELAALYQCSCAIDRIAEKLTYEDFVEAATFARYARLPGEAGGIFRDPEHAKRAAKLYRELELAAFRSCGIPTKPDV